MPYCTIEEAWDIDIYPEQEQPVLKKPPAENNYGYQNKIYEQRYEPNPEPIDIPRPQISMKEQLSDYKKDYGEISNQYTKLIDELKKENRMLKDKLDELKMSVMKQQDKDSLFDVILYISTGVFVIFMMDNITSAGRRY
jgi:hypothetical protein